MIKRSHLILIIFALAVQAVFAWDSQTKMRGATTPGNIPIIERGALVVDSGMSITGIIGKINIASNALSEVIGNTAAPLSQRLDGIEGKLSFSSETNGVVAAISGGAVVNTGILLDNFYWQAGVTNLSQMAAFVAAGNQPNSYAKLDENGKIDADVIETIVIATAGGYYQP